MNLCKKCCFPCFSQPRKVHSVEYAELKQEPSHRAQERFKFPQAIESRPFYPPMLQKKRPTKRINSPHANKFSQVIADQPRLPDATQTNRLIHPQAIESRPFYPPMLQKKRPTKRINSPHAKKLSQVIADQPRLPDATQRKVVEPFMLPERNLHSTWAAECKLDSPLYARPTGKKLSCQHQIDHESLDFKKATLQFSLEYDMVHSVLTVHLMAAFNLPAMDLCGTSDPYVEIILYPNQEKAKSKTIEKCMNPKFNEKFIFRNVYHCDVSSMILHFGVYDFDKFKMDDKIGSVNVTVEDVNLTGELLLFDIDMHSKEKKMDSNGTILLSLSYDDYVNSLKGTLVKLGNLARKDILTRKSDPYVKVKLLYEGKRFRKWRSSTKTNNLNPDFHESFQFDLQDLSINDCQLCITVFDHDHMKRDDVIGRVCIGADVAQVVARKHWEEMLVSPEKVSRWHSLLPVN